MWLYSIDVASLDPSYTHENLEVQRRCYFVAGESLCSDCGEMRALTLITTLLHRIKNLFLFISYLNKLLFHFRGSSAPLLHMPYTKKVRWLGHSSEVKTATGEK